MSKTAKPPSGTPLTLVVPKPRNRLAALAKARQAGPHDGGEPNRRARRAAKQALFQQLSGRKKEDDPA